MQPMTLGRGLLVATRADALEPPPTLVVEAIEKLNFARILRVVEENEIS